MNVVYMNGSWDPLHIGHINALQFAANSGDCLVVGIATDDYIREYKCREPFYPLFDRIRILSELRSVDYIVPYTAPEDLTALDVFPVKIMVVDEFYAVGDNAHAERQRAAKKLISERGIIYITLPRTLNISSTSVRSCVHG